MRFNTFALLRSMYLTRLYSTLEAMKSSFRKLVSTYHTLDYTTIHPTCKGKDATEAFEDVGHSDEARALLPGMQVGEFEKGENVGLIYQSSLRPFPSLT